MNFPYFNRLAGALSALYWYGRPLPTMEARLAYATERAQAQNISVSDAISRNFAELLQGQLIYLGTALVVIGVLSWVVAYAPVPGWVAVALSFLPMALLIGLMLLGRRIPAGAR